jgi:hypothetical protein
MKEFTENNTTKNTPISNVGYLDGYHFEFEIDGYKIHTHGSAKSGKEQVYINDKKIAEKRSFKRKSILNFVLDENKYEIEFNMVSLLTGELHCSLIKNGTHIKTHKKALKRYYQIGSKRTLLWLFLIGGLVGYFVMAALLKL